MDLEFVWSMDKGALNPLPGPFGPTVIVDLEFLWTPWAHWPLCSSGCDGGGSSGCGGGSSSGGNDGVVGGDIKGIKSGGDICYGGGCVDCDGVGDGDGDGGWVGGSIDWLLKSFHVIG